MIKGKIVTFDVRVEMHDPSTQQVHSQPTDTTSLQNSKVNVNKFNKKSVFSGDLKNSRFHGDGIFTVYDPEFKNRKVVQK